VAARAVGRTFLSATESFAATRADVVRDPDDALLRILDDVF
jgi:hypothetical protein